jgi:3-deoxy-D-manno-octulosonic-acid transferase
LRPPIACDVISGLHFRVVVAIFALFVVKGIEGQRALWHIEAALHELLANLGEALLTKVAQLQEFGLAAIERGEKLADLDDPGFDASSIDLLIGDSMGEMDAWYALADCAIIGGSLLPFGSQNLIEACAAGCPVVIGPSTFNFAQAAAQALEAGAAQSVADADDAIATGLAILSDLARKQAMAEAGTDFASRHRGATERTVAALTPLLAASLRN